MGVKTPENEYSSDPFDDMWYSADSTSKVKNPEQGGGSGRHRSSNVGTVPMSPPEHHSSLRETVSRYEYDDEDGDNNIQAHSLADSPNRNEAERDSRPNTALTNEYEHSEAESDLHDPNTEDEGHRDNDVDVDEDVDTDDDETPVWEDAIVFEEEPVHIDLPDRGQNLETSISDILRWSLRRRRVRQHHRQMRDAREETLSSSAMSTRSGMSNHGGGSGGGGGGGGGINFSTSVPFASAFSAGSPPASLYSHNTGTTGGSGVVPATAGPRASLAMTSTEAEIIAKKMKDDDNDRPWLANKPYKVYDPSFSQRVEDPFESLFDQCVRKGLQPSIGTDVNGENTVIVGIETQVGPAETCGFPESECFTYLSESVDSAPGSGLIQVRVRRRLIQARAAPLKDGLGEHIGGVVWLRDITGEAGAPKELPFEIQEQASISAAGLAGVSASNQVSLPPASAAGGLPPGPPLASSTAIAGFQGPAGMDPSAFWQRIINSMPQMVWVTKPDGNHIYFKWVPDFRLFCLL